MMTMPHPLSLSDQQLAVLMSAAQEVPVQWRSRLLGAVADHLVGLDEVQDAAGRGAVDAVLARINGAAT